MAVVRDPGRGNGGYYWMGTVSVWEDRKGLEVRGWMAAERRDLLTQNCACKNGLNGEFYVMCILAQ